MTDSVDPQSMTADERRQEVVSILLSGLLRCISRQHPTHCQKVSSILSNRLDLPARSRLNVAP
jgi:hypothetical protein